MRFGLVHRKLIRRRYLPQRSPTPHGQVGHEIIFIERYNFNDQDTLIGTDLPIGALRAIGTEKVELPVFALPATEITTGKYVIAWIDPDEKVEETDMTNDVIAFVLFLDAYRQRQVKLSADVISHAPEEKHGRTFPPASLPSPSSMGC